MVLVLVQWPWRAADGPMPLTGCPMPRSKNYFRFFAVGHCNSRPDSLSYDHRRRDGRGPILGVLTMNAKTYDIRDFTLAHSSGVEVNTADLPDVSLCFLAQGKFTHYFGSELAAKVTEFKKKNPDAAPDAVAAFESKTRAAFLEALVKGEKVPTVVKSALESRVEKLATESVRNYLDSRNQTVSEEELAVLVARVIENKGDALREKAAAELEEERAARTSRAKVSASEVDVDSIDIPL
jgi:hypothetical protein